MGERVTDGVRRLCGLVNGMRDNEFATVEVRKAAVAEECDRIDAEADAMRGRLMSGGCSWPRFEDGEPVRIGDEVQAHGRAQKVYSIRFKGFGYVLHLEGTSMLFQRYGTPAKRPAPQVLDADGAEIRAGDELWHVSGYGPRTVGKVKSDGSFRFAGCERAYKAEEFTHRAPVLAADDRPLREGEHVWHVETGTELVVKGLPKPGEYQAVVVFAPPASHLTSFDPDRLTHERPDSLDRLAEDIGAMVVAWRANRDLFDAQEAAAGCVGENTLGAALDSLVRRARALAEREGRVTAAE